MGMNDIIIHCICASKAIVGRICTMAVVGDMHLQCKSKTMQGLCCTYFTIRNCIWQLILSVVAHTRFLLSTMRDVRADGCQAIVSCSRRRMVHGTCASLVSPMHPSMMNHSAAFDRDSCAKLLVVRVYFADGTWHDRTARHADSSRKRGSPCNWNLIFKFFPTAHN